MGKMIKIAVLFHHIGPYHQARLEAATACAEIAAVEWSADDNFGWGIAEKSTSFSVRSLFPVAKAGLQSSEELRKALKDALVVIHPDVVAVNGWNDFGSIVTIQVCSEIGLPLVVMSESMAWDFKRVGWKEWIKRKLVARCSTALVGGTPHRDYMIQLGMNSEHIFMGYDAVDNDYYAEEAARWRSVSNDSTDHCSLITDHSPLYFLASNRFIEKKNLFRLLEAYGGYARNAETLRSGKAESRVWDLCLLGDGELKAKLLAHCASLGLHVVESAPWEADRKAESGKVKTESDQPSVYFPGFRQVEELPRFYAHAGAFVHASTTEQWGLVVNEAMASSLPVLVSNRVGCAQDLVHDDINGFTFGPHDVEKLTELMLKISNPNFPVSAFGDASRSIISEWGPDRFASGLKSACETALQVKPKKAGILNLLLLQALIHRQ